MKKTLILVLALCFIMAVPVISSAKEKKEKSHKGKMHEVKGKEGGMHGIMMQKMFDKKVVATSDGGIVVLMGCKLMKYDSSLNLVKEVELNIDIDAMMQKMKECKEKMKKCNMGEKAE